MTGRMCSIACMGALVAGVAAPAWAQAGADASGLQAEVAALRAEVAQLRQAQGENWLNERRAEEVKSLIREVLSDADTRATLLQEGMTAGHDGGNFFLASADGAFLMEIAGQIQFRYVADFQDDRSDETEGGFQLRRTKLSFSGHVADPRLSYDVVLSVDREDGSVGLDDAVIGYDISDELTIMGGKFKLPFLRQELISSKRQLAADRGIVTEFFTLDRSEQVQLLYSTDAFRGALSFNDGADEELSTAGSDPVEYAFTGRVDAKLAGEWDQARDVVDWDRDTLGVFVGGAAHYQAGDGNNADFGSESEANYFAWTVDGQVETGGFSLLGAFTGGHIEWDDDIVAADRDMYGALVEAGYMVTDKLQPFARWEWLDDDTDGTDDLQAVTAGVNYYLDQHNAKFTTDVVWVYDGSVASNPFGNAIDSDGLGISDFSSAEEEDLFVLRAQFQMLF